MSEPSRWKFRRAIEGQEWSPPPALSSRRTFGQALAGLVLACPTIGTAQRSPTLRRIGLLEAGGESWDEVTAALGEIGWRVGLNLQVDRRHAKGNLEALVPLAEELKKAKVEIIVADGPNPALAARRVTTSIPIVFLANDAVERGLVASLAHPGGNATGFSANTTEFIAKTLSLLKEAKPSLRRVCMLEVTGNPHFRVIRPGFEKSCRSLGIAPVYVGVGSAAKIDVAIAEVVRNRADALVLLPESFIIAHRIQIISMALGAGLPAVSFSSDFARDGALGTYSVTNGEVARRVAYFVDRILHGAAPAELPVEEPSMFSLFINLKTAKTLGITVPRSLLVQADELIQ